MNPMTNVKNITKLNEREIQLGINASCSWHKIYHKSPWVFVGGLDYELTEGDIICVFSQYGEVEDINLVKDKKTKKSKGFCFLCYQNNKSTILAVDNFNGIKLCGRTIRVDHVANYRPPKEESESGKEGNSSDEDIMDIIDPKRKRNKKRKHEEEDSRTRYSSYKQIARDPSGERFGKERYPVKIKTEDENYGSKYSREERELHRKREPNYNRNQRRFEKDRLSCQRHQRMDSSSDESVDRYKEKKRYRSGRQFTDKDHRNKQK